MYELKTHLESLFFRNLNMWLSAVWSIHTWKRAMHCGKHLDWWQIHLQFLRRTYDTNGSHLDDHIERDGEGGSCGKPRGGEPHVSQHTLPLRVQLALIHFHILLSFSFVILLFLIWYVSTFTLSHLQFNFQPEERVWRQGWGWQRESWAPLAGRTAGTWPPAYIDDSGQWRGWCW